MLQPHAVVAYNALLAARTIGVMPCGVVGGTVARVDFHSQNVNSSGDTVFDVLINGVSIWAGSPSSRPKILLGQHNGNVTGLSVAVAINDEITILAVTVPAGGIGGTLSCVISIDDGLPSAGTPGTNGTNGVGVPAGGTTGQILAKINGTDYNDHWIDPPSGGGSPSRADVVKTTASLADAAVETGTVALGKSFMLLRVMADRACRVRLYTTAQHRTDDASRPIGTDPTGEHGVILDANLVAGNLTLDLAPLALGTCLESSVSVDIPYAIQNKSGATSTVQVTFTAITMES
jgi:hypothetical protein